jgi:hypothetical protein
MGVILLDFGEAVSLPLGSTSLIKRGLGGEITEDQSLAVPETFTPIVEFAYCGAIIARPCRRRRLRIRGSQLLGASIA